MRASAPPSLVWPPSPPPRCAGFRDAHLRDAAVLTAFFAWLEAAVVRGVDLRTGGAIAAPLTEFSAGSVLDGMRAAADRYFALSFQTIAGMGPNGAVIHYRAEEATARPLSRESFFLVDSGGNYLDGTTDVTRTLHFGEPTAHERLCYTRVLQARQRAGRGRPLGPKMHRAPAPRRASFHSRRPASRPARRE